MKHTTLTLTRADVILLAQLDLPLPIPMGDNPLITALHDFIAQSAVTSTFAVYQRKHYPITQYRKAKKLLERLNK